VFPQIAPDFCAVHESLRGRSDDFRMTAIRSLSGKADMRATVANRLLVTLSVTLLPDFGAVQHDNMRGRVDAYRGENSGPGKDNRRELGNQTKY
jgi:hypothetical protein